MEQKTGGDKEKSLNWKGFRVEGKLANRHTSHCEKMDEPCGHVTNEFRQSSDMGRGDLSKHDNAAGKP